jgi:hypothetical protein
VTAIHLQVYISIFIQRNKEDNKYVIIPTRNEPTKEQLRNNAWCSKMKPRRNISLEWKQIFMIRLQWRFFFSKFALPWCHIYGHIFASEVLTPMYDGIRNRSNIWWRRNLRRNIYISLIVFNPLAYLDECWAILLILIALPAVICDRIKY